MSFFQEDSFCIVTGSSKGLGREIALQFSRQWSQAGASCDIVITGRNQEALEETKALIISSNSSGSNSGNSSGSSGSVNVHVVAGDLGDMQTLHDLCSELLRPLNPAKHKRCVLVNNAGTIDDFDVPFLSLGGDACKIRSYFDINVVSMIVLTMQFLTAFPEGPCNVVEVTSLLGRKVFPGFPLYSTVKASRTAFMDVVKAEKPSTRLLKYSPGPCDTDMIKAIPERLKGPNALLKPETSIAKLVQTLKDDRYDNGGVVDYYNE